MSASLRLVRTVSKGNRRTRQFVAMEMLESRTLLSSTPTDFEQFMLQLINRARANPGAEAATLGIDLNEGLAPGTISGAPEAPLAFNTDLVQASQDYTTTLLGAYNYFDYGYNGTTIQSRQTAAGYDLSGNSTSTESIYVTSEGMGHGHAPLTVTAVTAATRISDLFIDKADSARSDRIDLLNPNYREIGIGFNSSTTYQGLDTPPDMSNNFALLSTIDFAASDADPNPILTGVVYADLTHDQFYAPGDGIGNATITATRTSDQMTFTTTSFSSGGYSLAVPAGTYTVVASGGSLGAPVTLNNVVVTTQNVEADFVAPGPAAKLAFATSSATELVGTAPIPAVAVNVEDSDGNIATADSSTVTLAIASGPPGGTIGGATSVAVNGVATFPGLSFTKGGTYTLTATDGSLTATPANSFTIDVTVPVVDSSFAAVSLPFSVEQVLQEPGGQILVVGHKGSTGNNTSQGVLEQLNSDGAPDTTFGMGGTVMTPIIYNDSFLSAAVESNGQIVAVGATGNSFLVARYNSDGSLDSTFDNGGYNGVGFGSEGTAVASSVAIEPDGSIVVGGEAGNEFAVARLTSAGALDMNFNPAGADDFTFPGGGERTVATGAAGAIQQILIEGDGKILGVGAAGTAVAVIQLESNGANDPSFGSSGVALINQLSSLDPNSQLAVTEGLALQPGGGILVAGGNPAGGLAAVRLTPAGVFDSSFGVGGISVASFGGSNDDTSGIVADPSNGQFLLVGTSNTGGTNQIAVAAFNPDGTVNTTFGTNGQFLLPDSGVASASITSPLTLASSPHPFAFHPQLSDFAFATFGANGKPLVGVSGASSATLARLNVFSPAEESIGSFGKVGRKIVKIPAFTLADGTSVTITAVGGSGTATHVGNQVELDLVGATSVTIKTRGGSNSVSLSAVNSTGILHGLNAPTATLAGTLSAPGTIGMLKLASITGVVIAGGISNLSALSLSGSVSCTGVIATAKFGVVTGTLAAGIIHTLTAGSLSGATILAGVNLGADGEIGGSGSAADTYGAGQLFTLSVTGAVANSFIGAGVNPVDGIFGDGDDTLAGAGVIRAITVKGGVDTLSKFEAGVFPKTVHIPAKVTPSTDSRFITV